jgi:hypothetical protein
LVSPALADDFTISVPVEVSNLMPQIGKVGVHCSVLDSKQSQLGAGWSPLVAVDAKGNYKGTLIAKITANPGVAAQAKTYRCTLALAFPDGKLYATDLTVSPAPDDLGKPKPGTPFVPAVTGPVP